MSSKRNSNRKAKAKPKQSNKGKSSILGMGTLEEDKFHNQSLPCCNLLRHVARDIFCTEGDDSSSSSESRPTSLLGHMLRTKLLEERQKQWTLQSVGGSEPSSSNKKKKKKKKKKAKAGAASLEDTAFETTIATDFETNSASQDSQVQDPSSPTTKDPPASTETTNTAGTEKFSSYTGPVESYLDRVLQRKQERSEAKPPIQRDIHSFVDYLNQKLQRGVSVPHSQLEAAAQSITCPACRSAVNDLLQKDTPEPIVLNPIQFTGAPSAKNSKYNNSKYNNVNNEGNKKHNNLEVPILNQKPWQAKAQAQVQDFDYVALEEGTNPMATMMEVQASRSGVAYFHPVPPPIQPETNSGITATAGTSNGNGKKQTKTSASELSAGKPVMEWQFVAASAESEEEEGASRSKNPVNVMSVQSLENVIKDLVVPLALSPDELMGAYTDLGYPELQKIFQRVQALEESFSNELRHCQNEAEHYGATYNELWQKDSENNLEFKSVSGYHDLDNAVHDLLKKFIVHTIWDRLLWLTGSGNTVVVWATPTWENVVSKLTEMSLKTILGVMKAVETYEHQLEDFSTSLGAIPVLYISKSHRQCYRAMIETKLQLVINLIEQVRQASSKMEPAMFAGEGELLPHAGTNALLVSFRRKWFTQQEFFRQVRIQQKRDVLTSSDKVKGGNQDSVTSGGTSSDGQCPEVTVSDNWIQTLDISVVDLVMGLLNFAKTIRKGRIWEIKEEHMVECQKLVGLLARVGYENFQPLVERDGNNRQSFLHCHLLEHSLRKQCETIWSQIQQQKAYLHSVQMEEVEYPPVDEQKEIVAKMAVDAIRLLRQLRKWVTVNFGPETPPPSMPLRLVAWMSPATPSAGFATMDSHYYDNLVSAAVLAESTQSHRCLGGAGESRTKSLLLALFYQRLSDQCSEWHAELAEQELLTAMNTDDNALNDDMGGSSMTSNVAIKDSDTFQAKAAKKTKKNKAKKATLSTQARPETLMGKDAAAGPAVVPNGTEEANDNASSVDVATEHAKNGAPIETYQKNLNEHEKLAHETASNGHLTGKEVFYHGPGADINKTKPQETIMTAFGYDELGTMKPETSTSNAKSNNGKPKETGQALNVVGTTAIDKKLGVRDRAGVFHSAESFFVGRLTAILNRAGSDSTSQGKASLEGAGVVFIS